MPSCLKPKQQSSLCSVTQNLKALGEQDVANSRHDDGKKNKGLKYWSAPGKEVKSQYVYLVTIFITISACEIDKQFSDDWGIEFEFNIGRKFSFNMVFQLLITKIFQGTVFVSTEG